LRQAEASIAAWSAGGKKSQKPDTILFDIPHGLLFQTHPELGKADNSGTLRLAFILYYDDIQINNPLGYAKGRNEVCMHIYSISPNKALDLSSVTINCA